MRCPKCGFISFDHLEECLKCNRNIKEVSDSLKGAVYNISAPTFLKYDETDEEPEVLGVVDSSISISENVDEEVELTDEYLDDDLEILVKGNKEEFDLSLEDDEEDTDISLDEYESADDEEEDGEIEIDMGQFENSGLEMASDDNLQEEGIEIEDDGFDISIPDELSDMSDLEPPATIEDVTVAPVMEEIPESPAPEPAPALEDDEIDLNLNDLDFDLNLDGLDGTKGPVAAQSPVVDLDDIDFSDALDQGPVAEPAKQGSIMDDDLDFELDLGGLSIHKDK